VRGESTLLTNTITLVGAIVLVIYAIVTTALEWLHRLETYPTIRKFVEAKTLRAALLIVAIILLFGVFQDINAVREALNAPPPNPKAPSAPIISNEEAPANLGNIAKNPTKSDVHVSNKSSGNGSPGLAQSGQNNIAQVGDNNQATINPEPPEKNWVIREGICRKLLGAIRSTGSIQVGIGAFISDPDGANVVKQLDMCLPVVQGWSVTMAVLPSVPEAVTVVSSAQNESIATTLRDALRSIGFDANFQLIPNSPDIEVWIGKHAFKQPQSDPVVG
jgi:hypothetical protein